jgi:hypothetical protein
MQKSRSKLFFSVLDDQVIVLPFSGTAACLDGYHFSYHATHQQMVDQMPRSLNFWKFGHFQSVRRTGMSFRRTGMSSTMSILSKNPNQKTDRTFLCEKGRTSNSLTFFAAIWGSKSTNALCIFSWLLTTSLSNSSDFAVTFILIS